jgi:probable F420-dependent oxidoreductase
VSRWHGRPWGRVVTQLRETTISLRPLLAGEKPASPGAVVKSQGFRLRLDPPRSEITVAAFGDGTIRVAAELGDRMVVNLVTPEQAARLREKLERAAHAAGRATPPLAAWVVGALDPTDETLHQIRQAVVVYLAAPGYGEMFTEAGFGDLVRRARSGAHPRELVAAIPPELIRAVGAVGDEATLRRRIEDYRKAGVDAVAIVPATAGDPAARRTLAAIRRSTA